jgi:chromosome segregation protein
MEPPNVMAEIFSHGSRWVRVDFHLHTQADKEFAKPSPELNFKKAYVTRLKEEEIRVGAICNHNKFDLSEFKTLRNEAAKEGILLLPGVELSLQGGSGVHVLILFEPNEWIDNQSAEDFINRLLDVAFPHKTTAQRESENANSDWHLGTLLEELDKQRQHGRDSFLVMAHVDDAKGCLKELGALMGDYFNNELFQHSVLAFQKCRSRNNWSNLKQWLKSDWKPARVEGSDCKSLADVGVPHIENQQEQKCYVKLGELSFNALRLALEMHEDRVSSHVPHHDNIFVTGLKIESAAGGILPTAEIKLNSDLNTLIGIRGSGKSSILECLRYALSINLSKEGNEDFAYKEKLVELGLGSGGKVSVFASDPDGKNYTIERIFGQSARVTSNGGTIANLRPSSLLHCHYFGQKDLAKLGDKETAGELLERFIHQPLAPIREEIFNKTQEAISLVEQNQKTVGIDSRIHDIKAEIAATKETLKAFTKHKIEDKLKEQIAFQKDERSLRELGETTGTILESRRTCLQDNNTSVEALKVPESLTNSELFETLAQPLKAFQTSFKAVIAEYRKMKSTSQAIQAARETLTTRLQQKQEAFAEIKRNLSIQKLSADSFLELNRRLEASSAKLIEYEKVASRRIRIEELLEAKLRELQEIWRKEFLQKQELALKLRGKDASIKISIGFKEDKASFTSKLQDLVRGSGIQARTLEKLSSTFSDGVELYLALKQKNAAAREAFGSDGAFEKFRENISQDLSALVTFRIPDKVTILYHDKPLGDHSLGQRATALIIFLLTQADFDCIMLDQPEDDLDNQTIYEDVIRLVLELKGKRQMIFATHNANIPVLGDAEQIIRCGFDGPKIKTLTGSIDSEQMQHQVITVMEGGAEAFARRKRIYERWKPSKS